MKTAATIIFAVALGIGCSNQEGKDAPAPEATSASPAAAAAKKPKKKITAEDVTRATYKLAKKVHGKDPSKESYVPAEFKAGKKRWRDATAYVDGKPVGLFWFGELPTSIEPVWVEEDEDVEFSRARGEVPTVRLIKTRRYRLWDYLEAVGVDMKRIKEVHVYGPNDQVLAVDRKKLEEFRDTLRFRFGGGTEGKAIADIPRKLGRNMDRLMGVCVYIDKKPPKVIHDDGVYLNGKLVDGVPYYGEPLRGGIRIYKDDRLAARFKRNKMNKAKGTKNPDGTVSYRMLDALEEVGVATKDIVQLELIHDDRRTARFDRADIETMTFRSIPQAKGQIEIDGKVFAHSLAFFTKKLPERVANSEKDHEGESRIVETAPRP